MAVEYWRDDDGDGKDDSTGLTQREWDGYGYAGTRRFQDENNDGRDDNTGLDRATWTEQIGAGSNARDRDAAAAQEAYDRHNEAYAEYDADPNNRTNDLDAGRRPMTAAQEPGDPTAYDGLSQWQRDLQDVPILGWLTGADSAADAARAADAETRNRNTWADLSTYAPTANDLAVNYGELKRSELAGATGDPAAMRAERRALEGFGDIYRNNGLTAGDRARLQQGQAEMGRAMRSQRDADMSALRARGMGGSGAAISSMLSAQQGGADMYADRERQMQIAAQDRAMQALAGAGNMSSRMRASGWNEDTTRRGAMDEFNRWNIGQRDKTAESRSQARQQAYENRERQAAGMTGQYSTDVSRRAGEGRRDDERNQGILGAIGEMLDL